MNKPALEEIYRGSFKNRNRHGVEMHGTGGDIGYIATPENQYQTYNPVTASISYSSASPNGVAGYGMGNNSTIPSAQSIAGIGPNDGLTTAQQQTLATEMAADNANSSSNSSSSSSSSSGALSALAKELGISSSSSSGLQALLLGVGLLGAAGSYSRNKSVSQLPSIPQTGLFNANSSSSIGNQPGASYGPNGNGYNYTAYKGAVSGTPGTGYAPRTMLAPMPSSSYYTYGQMPEHNFFAPVSAKKGGHITTPQRFLVGGLSNPGGTVGQTAGNPGGPSGAALPAGSQASSSGINSGGTPSGYTPPAPTVNAGMSTPSTGTPGGLPVGSGSTTLQPGGGAGSYQNPLGSSTYGGSVQSAGQAMPGRGAPGADHATPFGQNPVTRTGLPVGSGPTTLQSGTGANSYMNPLGNSTSGGSMQNASSSAPAAGAAMGPAADNLGSTLYAGSELPSTGALNPGLAKLAMSQGAQNFMKQPGMASYLQANPGIASALQNPGALTTQGITNWYNNAGPGVQSYLKSNPGLMNSVEQAARPYAHGGAAPEPQGALSAMSRHVQGPGDGTSDSIPARLANGEYVMDAQTVSMLGNGDNGSGAKRLDEFRQNLRKHKGQALARGKMAPDAKPVERYMGGSR